MECIAYIAGERHSDHPACACPVLTELVIFANDGFPQQTAAGLREQVLRLAGSRADAAVTRARTYYLLDYFLRDYLPRALPHPCLGRPHLADALALALAHLPEISDAASARNAQAVFDLLGPTRYFEKLFYAAERALSKVEQNEFDKSARYIVSAMAFVEREGAFRGVQASAGNPPLPGNVASIDVLGLIDQLLAIGEAPPLEVTRTVQRRINLLTGR